MRIYSYIKNNLDVTKKELRELFEEKRILVNNNIKNLSYVIKEGDIITLDGKIITEKNLCYYLYNKPIGIICTNDTNVLNNIKDHVNINQRVFAIGRLDKMSHGLMILTNDGLFNHAIINPTSHVEKEYIVKVKNKIDKSFISKMEDSYILSGKQTQNAKATLIDDYTFSIILKEGKYHQIRLMVKANNNQVVDLFRYRIGNITIDDLDGQEIKEVKNLKEIIK